MSRCFPYPPPGYTKEGIDCHAFFETIKLQREAEKAKKEKKRENKRAKVEGEGEHKKHQSKKRKRENEDAVEKKANDPELLDKSTVTGEFLNPSNSQSSFNSDFGINKVPSDCKQNGEFHVLECKDQKQGVEIELAYEGNVFRIRFPVPKQLDSEATEEAPPRSTNGNVPETFDNPSPDPVYQKYLDYVVNWVPEEVEINIGESDTEWLSDTCRLGAGSQRESSGCNHIDAYHSGVPRAQYSSDAGLYVMPYTIPF